MEAVFRAYLVIQAVGHRGAQIPQVGLDVAADDLLVKNVDLQREGGGGAAVNDRPAASERQPSPERRSGARYDCAVKRRTRKNSTNRTKKRRRSSKKNTKTRRMTPHAMWRHMAAVPDRAD